MFWQFMVVLNIKIYPVLARVRHIPLAKELEACTGPPVT